MNRILLADVDEAIHDSTAERLLQVLSKQLDDGGCTCVVVHVQMMKPAVGRVDASCGHEEHCPMEHVGSVDEPTVVLPPGGAN